MQFEDVRFLSSLLVIVTYGLIFHLLAMVNARGALAVLTQPLVIAATFFMYIWFIVFGQWVSRARRALFNEQNILVTYQPRALTHGHLFEPDPPTPARSNSGPESSTATEFRNARDAHYRDEFINAKKASEERKFAPTAKVESMRIEFDDPSSPSTGSTMSDKSPGQFI